MWKKLLTLSSLVFLYSGIAGASGICGSPPDLEYESGIEAHFKYTGNTGVFTAASRFDSLLASWINCEIYEQLGGSNFVLGTYLTEMIGTASTQALTHRIRPRGSNTTISDVRSTTIVRPPLPFVSTGTSPAATSLPAHRGFELRAREENDSSLIQSATPHRGLISHPSEINLSNDLMYLRSQFPSESCQSAMAEIPRDILEVLKHQNPKTKVNVNGTELMPGEFKAIRYCIDDRTGQTPRIIQDFVSRELESFMQDPVRYYEAKLQGKQLLNTYANALAYFTAQIRPFNEFSSDTKAELEASLNQSVMFAVASGIDNDSIGYYVEKGKMDAISMFNREHGWGGGLTGTLGRALEPLVRKPINIFRIVVSYYIGLGITDQLTWLKEYPTVQAAVGQSIASGAINLSSGGSLRDFSRNVLIAAISAGMANEVTIQVAKGLSSTLSADALLRFSTNFQAGLQNTLASMARGQKLSSFIPSIIANSVSAEVQTLLRIPTASCRTQICLSNPGAVLANTILASYSNHVFAYMLGLERGELMDRVLPQPSLQRRANQCVISRVPGQTSESCPVFPEGSNQFEVKDPRASAGISFETCNSEAQSIANLCSGINLSYFSAGALAVSRLITDNGLGSAPTSSDTSPDGRQRIPGVPSGPTILSATPARSGSSAPSVPVATPPVPTVPLVFPVTPIPIFQSTTPSLPAPAVQAPVSVPQTTFVCRPGLTHPETGQRCPMLSAPEIPRPRNPMPNQGIN